MTGRTSAIGIFLFFCPVRWLHADVLTLGPSNQEIVLTSNGPDASGAGNFRVTLGGCSLLVTNTVCTVSGRYSGLASGIYSFVLTYQGIGPSPLSASAPPGTDNFTVVPSNGSLVFTIKPDGGAPASFFDSNATFTLAPANSRCFGITVCSVGTAGRTAGSTLIGPLSGQFDVTPAIRANGGVITAGGYGASLRIAPATWVEIYGTNLAATLGQSWRASDFKGTLAPTALAGTSVTIGGLSAFVQYVSNSQINVLSPMALNPGRADVIVTTPGGVSLPYLLTVAALQPAMLAPPVFQVGGLQYTFAEFAVDCAFVLPPGAITGVATRRAVPGDIVTLYGIGFGPVIPGIPVGQIVQQPNMLPDFRAFLGGQPATVLFAGLVYGFVGLYQFNVVIPGIPPNDATPFTFSTGGVAGTQTLYLPIAN